MKKLTSIIFALISSTSQASQPVPCTDKDYPSNQIEKYHFALYQKTGIPYSNFTDHKTKKLACVENRSTKELVAGLIEADATKRIALREGAKLIANSYLDLTKSAITGKLPFTPLYEAGKLLNDYRKNDVKLSSPLPGWIVKTMNDQAILYTLHYCNNSTRLSDCRK